MSEKLAQFFAAWGEADAAARDTAIRDAVVPEIIYSDPRTGARLTTVEALTGYVGQFSANAPGWAAWVTGTDTHNGFTRAMVAFGTDGTAMQTGTYFAELDADGRISLLAGFVGGGA